MLNQWPPQSKRGLSVSLQTAGVNGPAEKTRTASGWKATRRFCCGTGVQFDCTLVEVIHEHAALRRGRYGHGVGVVPDGHIPLNVAHTILTHLRHAGLQCAYPCKDFACLFPAAARQPLRTHILQKYSLRQGVLAVAQKYRLRPTWLPTLATFSRKDS